MPRMSLLLALALQDAALDALHKFKPETAWTYKRLEGGVERKIAARAVGESTIEWKELNADGTPYKNSELRWVVKEGILWAEAKFEDGDVMELSVLKAGTKKDDRWTTALGESTHLGVEELKVAAGTYKNAVKTRLKIGPDDAPTVVEFHLVPGVGLARITVVVGGGAPDSFELTDFKPAR